MQPDPAGPGFWPRLLGAAAAGLLTLWSSTWRIRCLGLEHLDVLQDQGRRTLVLFWHGKYPPLFPLLRGRRACVLTNRSFRGRIIGQICRLFGYTALNLPEEPGKKFLLALRQSLEVHNLWGTAADGPLGPYHHIKPRTLELAAHFGFTLLPVGVATHRGWRLKGRWDKMELPLPFSRIGLVVGEPLPLPPGLGQQTAGQWLARIQAAMAQCDAAAETLIR
jgi:lysophospholipid acyltransferase (LPLAT)-like uncharacterized protein